MEMLSQQNWQKIRDGIMEPQIFWFRANSIRFMRKWFESKMFLEVETPLMLKKPGMEPHLNLFGSFFETPQNREKRYLHTSPEYAMKKLLGAGFEQIFQITKVFRNGEWSSGYKSRHNPEFTMIEWYRANANYQDIMDDTESLIRFMSEQLGVSDSGKYGQSLQTYNLLQGHWERLSVKDAFKIYADIDLEALSQQEQLASFLKTKGYEFSEDSSWDDLFFLVLLQDIEPHLGVDNPVFLYDYPSSQAALAVKKTDNSFWAERFELYINGVELCNAFTELVDPIEQKQRLEEEQDLRRQLGKEVYSIDEFFLEALKTMPPSGGNALGVDRLLMVLLGKSSIRDVLLFPWEDA